MMRTVPFPRLDYDRIAGTYHRRYDVRRLDGVAQALRELQSRRPARKVLEAGCGTGRWLREWENVAWVVGLDRSARMIEQAPAWVPRVQGDAAALPFPPGVFDFLYVVNALHHFGDPEAFIRQAAALIVPGGLVAVVTLEPRQLRHRWYLYDYFPGVWEMDLGRFPALEAIADWFAQAGLTGIERRVVQRISDNRRGREIFASPFLAKDSCSQFALLSDRAYQEGLARLEAACRAAEDADRDVIFPAELALHLVCGQRDGEIPAAPGRPD